MPVQRYLNGEITLAELVEAKSAAHGSAAERFAFSRMVRDFARSNGLDYRTAAGHVLIGILEEAR